LADKSDLERAFNKPHKQARDKDISLPRRFQGHNGRAGDISLNQLTLDMA